jgi:hypothetical protein
MSMSDLVSLDKEVTPLPTIPHGIIWLNQVRSVLQFRATPCVVTQRLAWTPSKVRKSLAKISSVGREVGNLFVQVMVTSIFKK